MTGMVCVLMNRRIEKGRVQFYGIIKGFDGNSPELESDSMISRSFSL